MNQQVAKHYVELEHQTKVLMESLSDLSDAELSKPEAEGKWSINQVLVHLCTSEHGIYRYIQYKLKSEESFKKGNLLAQIRFLLLHWALKLPFKYKMPKVLESPSNEIEFDKVKKKYEGVRIELAALFNSLSDDQVQAMIFKHPFAGRFSLVQTVRFMSDHFDHHVKQINRIRQSF